MPLPLLCPGLSCEFSSVEFVNMRKAANPSWKVDFLLPGIIPRLGCSAEKVFQRFLPPPSSSLPSLPILPPFSWFYRGSSATACRSCGRSRNEPAVSHDFQLKVPPRRGKKWSCRSSLHSRKSRTTAFACQSASFPLHLCTSLASLSLSSALSFMFRLISALLTILL